MIHPQPSQARSRVTIRALGLVTALASSLGGCGGRAEFPPSASSALQGKPLPAFERDSLRGERVDTKALVGRVVVVKFFAKYCEPCKKTLPEVESLAKDHPEVAFVGVAEDEAKADVDWLVATYGLTFPVVHDRGNTLSGRFRVTSMPITFVADKTGTIRWVGGPEQTGRAIGQAIEAAE